jgi:hypothetical protein
MRLSVRGAKNTCVLIGGLLAGCGGVAVTQGEWALSAAKDAAAPPPMDAADQPMESMSWMVPPTNVGGSSSGGGASSGSGGASDGSSGGQDSGSSSVGSPPGPTAAPCTACSSDSDCSMTACGPPPQTGYFWCCVKSVHQCASQSYACGMSSSSGGDGGKADSGGGSSSGGPCGGNGEQCCTGMKCPNSPTQTCFMNMCY